jgi:tetratricopeptide (TPR) repeat protein
MLIGGAAMLALSGCERAPAGDALARAGAYMARSAYADARVELLNAARERPQDPAVHLATAETLLQLGDATAGALAAAEARRLGADSVQTAILLGDAAVMAGDPERALRHADSLPASHAADAERLRGGAALAEGDAASAIAAFRRGLEHRPADYRLHVELGYALLAQSEFGAAADHAAQAVRIAPERVGPHLLAARAAERLGRLEPALAAYDRALAISPNHLATLQDRAAALGDLGRLAELETMLDRADRVQRDHPRTLFLRAKLAAEQRRYRDAQSLLTRAGTALDQDVQAQVLSARTASELGMTSLALSHLSRAVTLAPHEPQLRILLAQMHVRAGNMAAADAALAPLAAIQPVPVEISELRAAMAAGGTGIRTSER